MDRPFWKSLSILCSIPRPLSGRPSCCPGHLSPGRGSSINSTSGARLHPPSSHQQNDVIRITPAALTVCWGLSKHLAQYIPSTTPGGQGNSSSQHPCEVGIMDNLSPRILKFREASHFPSVSQLINQQPSQDLIPGLTDFSPIYMPFASAHTGAR